MKLLAFSDLHASGKQAASLVEAAQNADLVIGAGDFCNARRGLDEALALLDGIRAPMVLVPGNAESAEELRAAAGNRANVLHGDGIEFEGRLLLFGLGYGVPLTPFGDWSCDLTEEQAETMLADCKAADILITHSPPKGVVDQTSQGISVGSTAIRAAIERIKPGLVLCGHIHDSWQQQGRIGETRVVNLGPFANWFEL
ncbi:metallophosphoesterase family protein [Alisedimentitalea sp. MJ-SS2]|uniref:metallophosphoesterase family protein n=1 Tax=Aliisedimentitalea sp. MJ-SS2 TaxID=3049795 RepID=UPI0029124382|nr:metallophosphoesterase family protein [Alisedimentitalea sp. MJ-SS2]MDU8928496.1 metallophosphoesterase family protein [Alisedimentitalea sp. MJ-SS2]